MNDATKPLDLKITKRDIEEGVAGDAQQCIIAKALCRNPDISGAEVRPNFALVHFKDGRTVRYVTSAALQMALTALDAYGARIIPPGTYTLEVPTGVRSLAGRAKARGNYLARKAAGIARTNKPRTRKNTTGVTRIAGLRSSAWGSRSRVSAT